MNKIILSVIIVLTSLSVNAQYYVSVSGGVHNKADMKLLSTSNGALKGSYGEGIQTQVRGGYFFNEKIGVDLGVGYLHGEDQQIRNDYLSINARARAFGASLAAIYNLSNNVYVRAGLITKIGGKSIAEGSLDLDIPGEWVNPALAGSGQTLSLEVEFDRDNAGEFPLGFVGAFGVKFEVTSNWSVFAEMEYQGIDVVPNKSTLTRYSGTLAGQPVGRDQLIALIESNPQASAFFEEDKLSIFDEFTYSNNPSDTQRKKFDAPYSSFGLNFGVIYTFKK
ncbi:porin family protein [Tenacibaculum haliotis]|uniref:porin family protein n=1 Tax=Tenacibaculum haliotis TaxID=1888914 RepID=UPI0021B01568|nr:porin family protein [Tenacibaculum haliotis]MCT4698794.1 porin family protein [Tenacibaculum haliotis]